ncbi:MAG: alpha/beta hydrolase [Alphaproteobacteria bacterium]|nr:alpha/beta hydrolase [Alphaproteobacteria bacterium]
MPSLRARPPAILDGDGGAAMQEKRFTTRDGLSLYYRDYGAASTKVPVLCLAGLSSNCRFFEDFALRWRRQRRILALDYRGCGRSAYDPNYKNYRFDVNALDALELLAHEGVGKVVIIGTSLGGMVAMQVAHTNPRVLAGVILNDIGPEVTTEARGQVRNYLDTPPVFGDWAAATQALRTMRVNQFPGLSDAQWAKRARQVFAEGADGKIRFDFDPGITREYRERDYSSVSWERYRAMKHFPVLALRGELSVILPADTFAKMAVEKPDLVRVLVRDRGHVPLLDEPECVAAFDAFFARV